MFFPQYRKAKAGLKIHPGLTILDYARDAGLEMSADCAGNGTCGKCIVRIAQGGQNFNPLTGPEKNLTLAANERLACQARVIKDDHDIIVFIKNFGQYEILKYGMERDVPLCPVYKRAGDEVLRDGVRVDSYRGRICGLAVDVGTTTLVFDVVDLETGDILATMARTNPQISYGNDVISRIEHVLVDKEHHSYFSEAERQARTAQLQKLVIDAVNAALKEFFQDMGEDLSNCLYEAVVVGNSTMRNAFFGLDIASLGLTPFEPLHKEPVSVPPGDIGLVMNPAGRVYGAALIGGHVGADILADILAAEMYNADEISMLVDIGTNGEVVLGNKNRLIAASCAAGGAFEGMSVSCGIGAIEGAIKEIRIADGKVVHSTIGNRYPVGVCGSGLMDLLAELLRSGVMSPRARIAEDFYITAEMKITQADIFQLITSKSALKTGEEILLNYYPVDASLVKKIFLSGGFGNFINVKNAMSIGLIPVLGEERIAKIGNGALEGAREMLLCGDRRKLSEELVKNVEHVKTSEIESDFDFLIAKNMYFE